MDLREKACFDVSDFLFGGVLRGCFLVEFIYNKGVYRWCIFRVLSVILHWSFCGKGGEKAISCPEKWFGKVLIFSLSNSLLLQNSHSKCAKLHRKRF